MSPEIIGFILFGVLLLLIFIGVHVGFALIAVGFIGFAILSGWGPALSNMTAVPYSKVTDYNFAAIPLFMLMSSFVAHGGIGRDAYTAARTWVGGVRGGLAIATTAAGAVFAAVCGSSLAAAVSFGNIAYPEMKRNGYDPGFASGTILAGASLSSMIPPSLQFIIIGILAQLSIGKLYIAGLIPGIVMFAIYVIAILTLCLIRPALGPSADIKTSFKQKLGSTYRFWPVIALFIIVLGGIYAGIFTAIEAGGIGAFGAFIISVAQRKLSLKSTITSLAETTKTASIIIIMLVGAFIFNSFLAITRVPYIAGDWMVSLPFPSMVTIIFILIVYIILGCFFDIYAILVITIPIVFPAVASMGYNLIWFSVIMVLISENGCMTPPFGINLFALSATTKQNITEIYKGVLPFTFAQLIILALLVAVPSLSLVLVNMMA